MLSKIYYSLVLTVCITAVYGLFIIKDRVATLTYQFNEINRQLNVERDMIHSLKAEFAYLSSPDRLKKLVTNYLALESVRLAQMAKDPLSLSDEPSNQNTQGNNLHLAVSRNQHMRYHNVKWRYKKAASKYLRTSGATSINSTKK